MWPGTSQAPAKSSRTTSASCRSSPY
jgi:hypothetical protein